MNKTTKIEKNDEIDLLKLFYELLRKWKVIVGFTLFTTILGLIYALLATPIYKADTLIQIEQKASGSLLKSDISSILMGSASQPTTEIELIQSRMILDKVINHLSLDVDIEESFTPIIGKFWARLTGRDNKIAISNFNVPSAWDNESVQLKIVDKNHYVISKDDKNLLSGTVGKYEQNKYISLTVNEINAEPNTIFNITKRSNILVIQDLLAMLSVTNKGKDSDMIEITLTGPDPILIETILEQINQNYLAQNINRRSEEASKSLDFLKEQLPKIKNNLIESENMLNLYRQQNDSVDLSLEAKFALDLSVQLEAQLNELTFKEAEVSKLYTKEHPAYRALLEKRETLLTERNKLGNKIGDLPQTQQEILRLTRDMQVNSEIYTQLINREQELSISQASTIGSVRIIDTPLTLPKPIKPQKALIVIISFLLGFILSSLAIIIICAMKKIINTTDQLENLGLTVSATIPLSEIQYKHDQINSKLNKRKKVDKMNLLSLEAPTDFSIEALRGLRTNLHFITMNAKNKVVVISGITPGVGKSFISSNFANIFAETKQKVLLIDGDLRKGYLQKYMHVSKKVGLSEYLCGTASINKIIRKTSFNDFLDFIPAGAVPPNPSELLMQPQFNELLSWANKEYDLVLIDTPPIMTVTDAAIIGKYADTVMLVIRYGKNTEKETELGLQRFESNNIKIKGVIFNGVVREIGSYYNYNYEYK